MGRTASGRPAFRMPWLAAAWFLAACAVPAATATGPEVRSLTIVGRDVGPHADDFAAQLATAADTNLPFTHIRRPFSEPQYLDPSVLEADSQRLVRLYQAHGYFSAKVLEVKVMPVS